MSNTITALTETVGGRVQTASDSNCHAAHRAVGNHSANNKRLSAVRAANDPEYHFNQSIALATRR
jgi:hypothetical protein